MRMLITLLLFMLCKYSTAQIKKGSILLGGQLGYYTDEIKSDPSLQKIENANAMVSVGATIKENLVLGTNLSYTYNSQKIFSSNNDSFKISTGNYNVGVFVREYKKMGKDFYLFGEINGGFSFGNKKTDYVSNPNTKYDAKLRGSFAQLGVGLSYKIFKKIQLELIAPTIMSMRYNKTKFDYYYPQASDYTEKQFSVSSSLTNHTLLGSLAIGFRFVL